MSQARYLPYGEELWRDKTSPTDFGFTGQRKEVGFGLYDYNARYYSPYLGRFVSPDTIVPGPENPQAWNRYAYTLNNPVRHTDPTGHCIEFTCMMNEADLGSTNAEITKSFPRGTISINQRPSPPNQALANILSLNSVVFDLGALVSSASGVAQDAVAFSKGFSEGMVGSKNPLIGLGNGLAEAVVSEASYAAFRDEIADNFSYVGMGSTAASDFFAGNTYLTYDNKDGHALVIGTSTQFSFALAYLGDKCPISACDAAIDSIALYNDTASYLDAAFQASPVEPLNSQLLDPLRLNLPDAYYWLPPPTLPESEQ